MRLRVKLGLVLLLAVLFLFPVRAYAATVSDISKQFICQCGCNMVLLNCTHAECGSREAMTALINQNLAQGQSEGQIIQLFVAQYGEQVLASPPKRGFNLVAWVTPFAAILFGGVAIYIMLKKWVWQGRRSQIAAANENEADDDEYRCRLEKELAEFTRESFR